MPTSVASEGDFNVYRLKENPTWVKFGVRGLHTEKATVSAASSFLAGSRPTASTVPERLLSCCSAASSPDKPSEKRSVYREASFTTLTPSNSAAPSIAPVGLRASDIVAAGAVAALRHERQKQQQQQEDYQNASRSTASFTSTGVARETERYSYRSSAPSVVAHSSTCPSANTSVRTSLSTLKSCRGDTHPPTLSGGYSSSLILRDSTNSSRYTPRAFGLSASTDHRYDSSAVACSAGSCSDPSLHQREAQPRRRPSPSPAPSSMSRAAQSHLSGSAAFVDVEGPMDSLYVPLRRPPPKHCAATRQTFSIFDGMERERVGPTTRSLRGADMRTSEDVRGGADPANYATLRSATAREGGALSWNTYQTSNGLYGKGC